MLDEMAEIPGLARIRLSSLEPADVTPRLLDTFCRHRNIMPHLHLPLQSGSQAILKRMCRQYRADEFRKTVASVKSRLDRPAITTDIIVGFPGETQVDFDHTVSLAKEVGFAKMHIFSFSPRRGTAAARMQDAVDSNVIRERSEILRELDIQLGLEYRQQFLGERSRVLLETDGGRACGPGPRGRSERYFTVYLENADRRLKRNNVVRVKLLKNNENGIVGAPLL
ncbi:MAG: radical SAM protein [Planctomycetota bacterium]